MKKNKCFMLKLFIINYLFFLLFIIFIINILYIMNYKIVNIITNKMNSIKSKLGKEF